VKTVRDRGTVISGESWIANALAHDADTTHHTGAAGAVGGTGLHRLAGVAVIPRIADAIAFVTLAMVVARNFLELGTKQFNFTVRSRKSGAALAYAKQTGTVAAAIGAAHQLRARNTTKAGVTVADCVPALAVTRAITIVTTRRIGAIYSRVMTGADADTLITDTVA